MGLACPSVEELEDYLVHRLEDVRAGAIEAHVDACPSCREALDRRLRLTQGTVLARPGEERRGPGGDRGVDAVGITRSLMLDRAARIAGWAGAGPPAVPGYELLNELGRGSMSVVYLARQRRLNRSCALKMIPAGALAGPEAVARFVAEAEAVARLQHPNVVRIHTIGEVDGLPFLELEYVECGSLDTHLDGTPWPPRRAAALVEVLARGIAEAHRRGIVHRDLKPGNILIAADGTPKAADFGIAKLLGSEADLTRSGAILGTPGYMAPEQAGGGSKAAGPPADIYALEAILYELLTGRRPFRGATLLETLEQVRAAEPVPPSRLVPGLPRDAETIALVCLRKEPERRYASAEALAEDLGRFLTGRAILARRSGAAERAWRWARRNPWIAASAAATAAGLIATTALAIALAWTQYQAAGRLRVEQARTLAEKREAEALYRIARAAADDFLVAVGTQVTHNDPDSERVRNIGRNVLEKALARYRDLAARRPEDWALGEQIVQIMMRIGDIIATARSTGESLPIYEQGIELQRSLVREDPGNAAYRQELGADLVRVGNALHLANRREEALEFTEEGVSLLDEAAAVRPDDAAALFELGTALGVHGYLLCEGYRMEEGLAALRRSIGILERLVALEPAEPDYPHHLVHSRNSIGEKLMATGRLAEALEQYRAALADCEAFMRAVPGNLKYVNVQAMTLNKTVSCLLAAGRPDEALPIAHEARRLWAALVGNRMYPVGWRSQQGDNRMILGLVLQALGRTDEALEDFRAAEAIHRPLHLEGPDRPWNRCSLALALRYQGGLLRRAGRPAEARAALLEARALLESQPDLPPYELYNLAACLAQLHALAAAGHPVTEDGVTPGPAEAQRLADLALDAFRRAVEGGFRPARAFEFDPDLEPLRADSGFDAVVASWHPSGQPTVTGENPSR